MTPQLLGRREQRQLLAALMAGSAMATQCWGAPAAQAQPMTIPGGYSYAFNLNVGGNPPPAGATPWLTANVTDNLTGGVFIDLLGNLQGAEEFITAVAFNLTRPLVPTNGFLDSQLWSCSSSDIDCDYTSIEQRYNAAPDVNLANAVQGFDLAINLPTAESQNRFEGSNIARFTILGLSPDDLKTTNDPRSPITGLWSAAKVQGTGPDGEGSTTIADPPGTNNVPGPLPILGAGLGLTFSRRLRNKQRLPAG